ncbi:MAG TPA: SDR family NAD(P)-dependent oxidoreductase [Ktedonobacterales bacterium]|jgi:short-subunit dehydrogenase|nr:SDR family NAD(P)-dependent oxidoreductase [Ktedonobacterales bacterium]
MAERTMPGALILGASSGIGAALARELARQGYRLALVARNEAALTALTNEINGEHAGPPQARSYPCDVRVFDDAPDLFQRINEGMDGALRVVAYVAGIMPSGKAGAWTFEEERTMIETNLLGAMRWLDLAAESFSRAGEGVIVGVSSVAGDRGRRGNSAYMASKAGLSTYLESLRYRLRGTGVRVITIKPGYVATPMTADLKLPQALTITPERAAKRIVQAAKKNSGVVYVPSYWAPIMWGIRQLPAAAIARLPI